MEKNINFQPESGLRVLWLIVWGSCIFLFCLAPFLLTIIPIPDEAGALQLISQLYFATTVSVAALVLLWLILYFKSLKYTITSTHVTISSGIIWRKVREIPYATITDVVSVQGPLERLFHLGHLAIQTAGRGGEAAAEGVVKGLPDFISKRQEIIGRITKYKTLQEIVSKKEEERNSVIHLLTGILNELRDLRICLGGSK